MRPLGLGWPNVLSIGRIALIPIVVVLLGTDRAETRWLAVVVFVVGALSDLVDGYLARRHEMTTGGRGVARSVVGQALRDRPGGRPHDRRRVPVVGHRGDRVPRGGGLVAPVAARSGGVSMPASRAGKAKTFSQILAVGLAIAPLSADLDPLVMAVIVVAVVLTVASGLEYLFTERHRQETGS